MGANQSAATLGQVIGPLIGYGALFLFANRGLGVVCLLLVGGALLVLRRVGIYG